MPTAIEIFKLLPKKNCGECKYPTCLAFAMQLANQKVKLEACPHISEQAKASLAVSASPPIRLVRIGVGESRVEIGDETEIYRHEKKFFHQTCYAVVLSDTLSTQERREGLERVNRLRFERIGQIMKMDMVGIRNDSGNSEMFATAVEEVSSSTDLPMVLFASDPQVMRAAVGGVAGRSPLLHAATATNHDAMAMVAKEIKCPLVVREDRGLDKLADLVQKVKAIGIEDIVLDFGPRSLKNLLQNSTIIRKVAVKKTFKGLGFPIMINAGTGERAVLMAMVSTMKYGGIVAFDEIDPAEALPLFVLRQSIYTDPQVPIQVKPDLYPINNPDERSPVVFTTNFSLTYFTVMGDIEKSKMPAWLQVVDTEGLSVMTAYAAGKLTPDTVAKALESSGAKDKSKRGDIIIPGMVSRMSAKLQEITGLKVIVGPKESSALPKFMKNL
ncbi:MAG: acetyl-CoA decarbonylase/synthase complex subunit gamma [Methanomassiliicoccales archaeon]|nr:acetyl-CoA decarbonylase/synthase complex subunit gamma [Methanomassiliicoccales archaeon]